MEVLKAARIIRALLRGRLGSASLTSLIFNTALAIFGSYSGWR
jgi:hypothetical protein